MMFVQSFIQIGSPIKQKIGYIWTQIFVVILYKKIFHFIFNCENTVVMFLSFGMHNTSIIIYLNLH